MDFTVRTGQGDPWIAAVEKRFVVLIFLSPYRSFPHGVVGLCKRKPYIYPFLGGEKPTFFPFQVACQEKTGISIAPRKNGGAQG